MAVAVAVTVVVVVVVTWPETMVVMAINPTEASDGQYEMRMIYVRDSGTREVYFEGACGRDVCAGGREKDGTGKRERRRSEGALKERGRR